MKAEHVLIIFAVLFLIILVIAAARNNAEREKRKLRFLRARYGKVPENEYTAEELASAGLYAKEEENGAFEIDDITYNDLALEDLYLLMNNTVSSPGDSVLMDWLRHPVFDKEKLAARDRLIELVRENQGLREKLQLILWDVGRDNGISAYELIKKLNEAQKIGRAKYIASAIGMLAGIALLFIQPLVGLLLIIAMLVFNSASYMHGNTTIKTYVKSFKAILRMLEASRKLAGLNVPEIKDILQELGSLEGGLKGISRGAFLVTSASGVGTGLESVLIEYMKMFFHVDLIKFDQMLDAYRGKEAAVLRMFELLGTLDTVCALASYREYLPVYTRGEFHFPKEGEKPVIRAEELVHPLLSAPVPNSFTVQGGNLITGSNASGKSTFLKSAAIAAIMGQTVCTVPAGAFSSPFIRVLTSMALTDNLSGGESYFIVEIRSLRRIMEASEDASSGIPVLGVVDEVLRGTNTIERIAASAEILAELAKKPAVTLAATHDIELANILKGSYRNLHFEEEIRDGDVVFSYKLLEGPATTRNAIRLLGLAGYDEEVVERARARAERFETTGNWT